MATCGVFFVVDIIDVMVLVVAECIGWVKTLCGLDNGSLMKLWSCCRRVFGTDYETVN